MLSRVVAALTVACGLAVLLGPRPLTIAGGLLLALVLPGLALIGVLFRRHDLTTVERIVLTPALSTGVLVVAGLGIHVVGLRIDRVAWTVATAGVTLAAVVVSRLQPRRVPAPPAPEARPVGEKPVRTQAGDRTPRVGDAATVVMSIVPVMEDEQEVAAQERARRRRLVRQLLPLALVALVLGGASWLSFDTSRKTHDTDVTALSAAPSGPVDASGDRTVRVSAGGLVAADGPYTIRVLGPTGTATLTRTVAVTGDGTWIESLSLPGGQRLTVNLYRAADTTAYRTLYLSAVD